MNHFGSPDAKPDPFDQLREAMRERASDEGQGTPGTDPDANP